MLAFNEINRAKNIIYAFHTDRSIAVDQESEINFMSQGVYASPLRNSVFRSELRHYI